LSKKQQNIIACIPAYNALSVILHYAVALDEGADPVKLGLTTIEDRGQRTFSVLIHGSLTLKAGQ